MMWNMPTSASGPLHLLFTLLGFLPTLTSWLSLPPITQRSLCKGGCPLTTYLKFSVLKLSLKNLFKITLSLFCDPGHSLDLQTPLFSSHKLLLPVILSTSVHLLTLSHHWHGNIKTGGTLAGLIILVSSALRPVLRKRRSSIIFLELMNKYTNEWMKETEGK